MRPRPSMVLVIEDDVVLREVLLEALRSAGFDARAASNGFTGLRLIEQTHPGLVLLDLLLPDLSGVEVLRAVKRNRAMHAIPVIVASGEPDLLTEADRASVAGVLRKPYDLADVLSLAGKVASRAVSVRSPVPPVVAPASPASRDSGERLYPAPHHFPR